MMQAYREGIPANGKPFPEGSKIVKIEWLKKEDTPFKLLVSLRHCPGQSVPSTRPAPQIAVRTGKTRTPRPKGQTSPLMPQLPALLGWSLRLP
jgi:hypothetical protein